MKHAGMLLYAANMILIGLLFYNVLTSGIALNAEMLVIAQILLAVVSGYVFYMVLSTFKIFREIDLLVGTVGFFLVFAAYLCVALLSTLNEGNVSIEAGLNTTIFMGYLFITIAAGWLKVGK